MLTAGLLGFVFASTCAQICITVVGYETYPQARGSYCKDDQNPPVCFGLYLTAFTYTSCYQPTDPSWMEKYPILCPVTPPPLPPTCEEICNRIPGCSSDPLTQGSHCKTYHDTAVCFVTNIPLPDFLHFPQAFTIETSRVRITATNQLTQPAPYVPFVFITCIFAFSGHSDCAMFRLVSYSYHLPHWS